jgi:hypothetical protein
LFVLKCFLALRKMSIYPSLGSLLEYDPENPDGDAAIDKEAANVLSEFIWRHDLLAWLSQSPA